MQYIKNDMNSAAQYCAAPVLKKLFLVSLLSFFLPLTSVHATLEGTVEVVNCDQVKGWAWDNTLPTTRVRLDIVDVGTASSILLTTLVAQIPRPDLLGAGKGDGKYGFSFLLPARMRNATAHTLSVRFADTSTELINSPKATLDCYGKLNDTGIKNCSDGSAKGLTCSIANYAGQDGDHGRDALARTGKLKKIGKGNAGFDFSKIANDGSIVPATTLLGSDVKAWACTLDNVTGLWWEVKTDDGGLRDKNNTYSWYNSDEKTNGGFAGYQNAGDCSGGIFCDTEGYVQAVNAAKLCGKSDWRLPKKSELHSIVDYSRYNPAIDRDYFPGTITGAFWSSTPYANSSSDALVVNFKYGYDDHNYEGRSDAVRLVRAGQ